MKKIQMKKIKIVITLTATFLVSTLNAQEQPQQSQPAIIKPLPSRVVEYGIGLSNLNSFSLQYRWGNETKLYRIEGNIGGSGSTGNSSNKSSTLRDTLSNSSSGTTKTTTPINLNCGFSFSILKIKSISEKFGFLYGEILGLSYNINQSTSTTNSISTFNTSVYNNYTTTATTKQNSQTFQPYVGIVLGAVYKISPSFLLYAEIDPNIYYAYNESKRNTTSSITYTNVASQGNNNTRASSNPNSTNTFGLSNLSNSGASLTIVYRITK